MPRFLPRMILDAGLLGMVIAATSRSIAAEQRAVTSFTMSQPATEMTPVEVNPGDLVRADTTSVYLIDNLRRKRQIPTIELFFQCGWQTERIRKIPDEVLEGIATGPEVTSC